ncbi:hypothetical protein K8T06_07630, partial [bacterium]|nr:hypothetical protein [bacterium]
MTENSDETRKELELVENAVLSGDIAVAESLLEKLLSSPQDKKTLNRISKLEIRFLISKCDFETALRRLAILIKRTRLKSGSKEWAENYLLKVYINQSLGHSSKAEKDLEKIRSIITEESSFYQDFLLNIATLNRDRGKYEVA